MIDYQDLEDRIASLERATRNIGIGQELVVGSLHALDKIVADELTANEIIAKKPPFNVKAWGAKGDNATDDRKAIQDAIDAANGDGGGIVYFPPLGEGAMDRYKVTSALDLKEGVSLLGASMVFSRISAHGSDGDAYPIFDPSGTAKGFFIKNLTIGFQGHYDNVLAKCLRFHGTPKAQQYIIENVCLRNGYYGFFDDEDGFHGLFTRVWALQNRYGFYKLGGGHVFINCYAEGKDDNAWDIRGWNIYGGGGNCVVLACVVDNYNSPSDIVAQFGNMSSFTILGFTIEGNTCTHAGGSILKFTNMGRFTAYGLISTGSVITTNTDDPAQTVLIEDCKAFLSGAWLGGTTVNSTNGGDGCALGIVDSSVSIAASDFPDPASGTGTPTVYGISMPEAGACELELSMVTEGTRNNPNSHPVHVPHTH